MYESVELHFGDLAVQVVHVLKYHEHDNDEGRYRYLVARVGQRCRNKAAGVWFGTPNLSPTENSLLYYMAMDKGMIHKHTKNYHPDKDAVWQELKSKHSTFHFQATENVQAKYISEAERAYNRKKAKAKKEGIEIAPFRKHARGVKREAKGQKEQKEQKQQKQQKAVVTGPDPVTTTDAAFVKGPVEEGADSDEEQIPLRKKIKSLHQKQTNTALMAAQRAAQQVLDAKEPLRGELPNGTRAAAASWRRPPSGFVHRPLPVARQASVESVASDKSDHSALPDGTTLANWWLLAAGDDVFCKDKDGFWLKAKVIERSGCSDTKDPSVHQDAKVLVHFVGWNKRYDEWISNGEDRVRVLPPPPPPPPPPSSQRTYARRTFFDLNYSSEEEEEEDDDVEDAPEAPQEEPPATADAVDAWTDDDDVPRMGPVEEGVEAPAHQMPVLGHSKSITEAAEALLHCSSDSDLASTADASKSGAHEIYDEDSDDDEDVMVSSLRSK